MVFTIFIFQWLINKYKMPKAFLLKYKKQCEYFAQTPDQIDSCETSTEAINLKIKTNDSAQDMMVKGKKIHENKEYFLIE